MRKLSLVLIIMLFFMQICAQKNPHGKEFKLDCSDCHTTGGWKYAGSTSKFNHNSTKFKLEGQHKLTTCASCHTSLVFSEAKTICADCHTDMHNATVGLDCARCHDAKSWLVSNITGIHQQSRFPLLGAHNTADCSSCHASASDFEFQPLGIECIDCHRLDYEGTKNPDHIQTGLSTLCAECHKVEAFEWKSTGFLHDFFPLLKGHSIPKCADCHVSGNSNAISNECFSCHQKDFNAALNPPHKNQEFTTDCKECHTTDFDWKPAKFDIHDNYFPVYSGAHREAWQSCTDCHKQKDNFSAYNCIDCHVHDKSITDGNHQGINGYSYNNLACFACHPTGNKEGSFNHNRTDFPLTGAHIATECIACHKGIFAGTPMDCNACHQSDFSKSTNPSHTFLGLSTDCQLCHTTNTGWEPAKFPDHQQYFAFNGTHATIANNCVLCHDGNYITTPNSCFGCHSSDYNSTKNPVHSVAQFSTDCQTCHTENAWTPSIFNHDQQYFPIYSGNHRDQWSKCADCHTQPTNYTVFSCINCHEHNKPEMDRKHSDRADYVYNSVNCLSCHPRGNN